MLVTYKDAKKAATSIRKAVDPCGYFKGACYHARQSVEKAMKAGLFRKGWDLEKTHSAARLAAIGKDLRVKFPISKDEIVFIDSIYRDAVLWKQACCLWDPRQGKKRKNQ